MTKQEYTIRTAYLGISSRDVAEETGLSSAQISVAVNGAERQPSVLSNRAKVDAFTLRKLNEKRAEMTFDVTPSIRAAGYEEGEIRVVLPADCLVAVMVGNRLVGWYHPENGTIKFLE